MTKSLLIKELFLLLLIARLKYGCGCKWSNEGCNNDAECCSQECHQAHPGTNPRCTKSSTGGICLYSYQCEDKLTCEENRCCSKYWGTCRKSEDCCTQWGKLICIKVKGFVYKRCQFPPTPGGEKTDYSVATGQSSAISYPNVLAIFFLYNLFFTTLFYLY